MSGFDRRTFLRRGTSAVAVAGVVAALPGSTAASALLGAVESDGPAADDAAAQVGESGNLTEPLVAHVRDLSSGEIGLFSGTREIVIRDPNLATRLFNATR